MGQELEFERTPLSVSTVRALFTQAWETAFFQTPDPASIDLLLAQSALETGNFASLILYNFGNVKASSKGTPDYTNFETTEIENGVSVPQVATFRAFHTPEEGAAFFIKFIHGFGGGAAWPFVVSGDIDGFAQALKDHSYYTSSEVDYANGMRTRLAHLPNAFDVPAALATLGFANVKDFQRSVRPPIGVDGDPGPVTIKAMKVALAGVAGNPAVQGGIGLGAVIFGSALSFLAYKYWPR